ncbi:hypothetical protein AAHV34_12345 [Klebsiella pneumoniae]
MQPATGSFARNLIYSTKPLRGHLSGQTPVDNVMNDLESVNFIQSKNAGA